MQQIDHYIKGLLALHKISISSNRQHLLDEFSSEQACIDAVRQIIAIQNTLMDKWMLRNRITDILEQQVNIPNGTVGKPYEARIDFGAKKWEDIIEFAVEGLADTGLQYHSEQRMIHGIPVISGDIRLQLKFKVNGEAENEELHIKKIPLVINPDPKSLWKNIDSNTQDPYWKEDNATRIGRLGDKNIVVVSKRGRSHANTGSFREDHFDFSFIEESGWGIIALSDGAGSARYSRQGSKIACENVVAYFLTHFKQDRLTEFDQLVNEYHKSPSESVFKKLNGFLYESLGKAAFHVFKQLESFAEEAEMSLKDLHSTLIFVLVKKYDFGYAVLSFGVGDCPIGLLNKDLTDVQLLNRIDVGEFGGGTRFITMQEIFQDEKFQTRLGFKLVDDFSYLVMMTDGIYDPKFVVEANLEKIEKWRDFLDDLGGNNEQVATVELVADNPLLEQQLSTWMDFWSPGNHDDRTLAIIF